MVISLPLYKFSKKCPKPKFWDFGYVCMWTHCALWAIMILCNKFYEFTWGWKYIWNNRQWKMYNEKLRRLEIFSQKFWHQHRHRCSYTHRQAPIRGGHPDAAPSYGSQRSTTWPTPSEARWQLPGDLGEWPYWWACRALMLWCATTTRDSNEPFDRFAIPVYNW